MNSPNSKTVLDDETQDTATDSLRLPLSNSADVCNQFMQSVVNTAKELLHPQKIFSFSIQDGKLMCTHETPPQPPRSRAENYNDECERYSKKEKKDTISVAQSLYAPASLKAFLVQASIHPCQCRVPTTHFSAAPLLSIFSDGERTSS